MLRKGDTNSAGGAASLFLRYRGRLKQSSDEFAVMATENVVPLMDCVWCCLATGNLAADGHFLPYAPQLVANVVHLPPSTVAASVWFVFFVMEAPTWHSRVSHTRNDERSAVFHGRATLWGLSRFLLFFSCCCCRFLGT